MPLSKPDAALLSSPRNISDTGSRRYRLFREAVTPQAWLL
jgi:hypothetical protein